VKGEVGLRGDETAPAAGRAIHGHDSPAIIRAGKIIREIADH
jgi:hypothetical protein